MMSWKTYLVRAAIGSAMVGVAVFAGVRLAAADPGGPTRGALTFAGVLRNTDGSAITAARSASLTFSFVKPGAPTCTPPAIATMIAAGGAFSVLVPIDGCGSSFFDGSNITYTVSDGSDLLTPVPQSITPVPYARFADQVGVSSDCPVGYIVEGRDPWIVCQRRTDPANAATTFDEVVRVGSGATAFWIDRYEVTICASREGTCGIPFNTSVDNDLASLGMPRNGQWTGRTPPLYARSGAFTNQPSRWVNWFQAEALCRASGKRLPTGREWLAAARGTGGASGDSGCMVNGPLREAASGSSCTSEWGARDMVGNLAEWTDEWFASVGQTTRLARLSDAGTELPATSATIVGELVRGIRVNDLAAAWPANFGGDSTANITSVVDNGTDNGVGIPAAAVRGGSFASSSAGGVFSVDLRNAPSNGIVSVGFRCVIPR